jgi:adenylate cyclase
MPSQGFKRKLTAILSADVRGYSRLMGEDEETTVRTVTAYHEVMATLILNHRGQVVDSPGDNLLAEFASVVDAVRCAVEIQEELKSRNAELPEDRRMEFRIGVNLGDVIVEGDRIYGDGVNIAARLEALADPGGICISKTAFDHIEAKLPLGYEYLGEQTVKNIAKPVGAYRVLMEPRVTVAEEIEKEKTVPVWRHKAILAGGVALVLVVFAALIWNFYFRPPPLGVASVEKMAFPLPDKPSIAVLPFTNMSGDPEQEYFSDGITEDLITDLSKISGLFVIARNSVFVYKGKAVKIAEVGRELGVRYVLEGSVRKANGRVRITAQLVDATTGRHLWAERYDRDLKDIFALQDEVAQKIVAALEVKLTEDEHERLVRKYTDNMEAYHYYLRGAEYFYRFTKEANVQARYAALGFTHFHEWTFGWSQDPQSLEHAFELAQRTLDLDESLPLGHRLLGKVYLWKKQHEKAIAELEKAIALNPNDADELAGLGYILNWSGRPEEAIRLVKRAMRLDPMYPAYYLWELGHAYFLMGRYEEAIETLKRVLDHNSEFMPAHVYLTASYIELGRHEEARTEAAEVLKYHHLEDERISPSNSSQEAWKQRLPYKDQAVLERLFDGLRKAGVK